jgi:uncharacterized membrane protein YphA (DoxX/SURF4 family)
MLNIVNIVRIIVGVLFIISGLIKVNDPSGLAYKMDEYWAVWGWHWADQFSLPLSIGMNVLEVVLGVALLLGWQAKRVTALLLLLIIFFTFLTGYAVLSGKIKTCGCFGDCIPLQAHQSFIKDLILLVLCGFLYWQHAKIKPFLAVRANLFLILFGLGFTFWGQLHVLKNLPVKDCLPYAVGNNLLEKMQPPPGSTPDVTAVFYTYKVDGKIVEFDANEFPDDFDEERYEYVSRENKVIRKGNATPAIQDMAFFNANGTDTTKALLNSGHPYLLWFAKDFKNEKPMWFQDFAKIFSIANEKGIPLLLVTNQPVDAQLFFNEKNNFKVQVLTGDGTVMKTMLRTPTGIIAMNGAVVKGKWSEHNVNEVVRFMNNGGFER